MQSQASCCPICYCDYDQSVHLPRLIPTCGHTFCSECLNTLIKSPNENKCPLDKTTFAPQMYVHDFPINFALKQLIEERCSAEICPSHKEEMRMICLTDKTKICEDCLYYGHNGHTIKPMKIIKGEADTKRREIETVLERLDSYNKEVNSVLEEKRMQLLKVIKERFTQLKWLLTKQEKEMTFEITSFFNYERNKMNKVIGVNSDLRKNLTKKISSLKNIFNSNALFKELEEDVSKITSSANQILTEKPINILRQELKEMTAPLDLFFGQQIDMISQIVFSHELAEKMSLTHAIFPDEPTTPKIGSSYTDSMAKGLFSIESKDNVMVVSSKNVLSEGKYHGDSILVGPNEWKSLESVNLKLCETDSPDEHAQTLFYIWRKIDKLASLKVDFTPDFIYFGDFNAGSDVNFDNYLVTLFPALFWKTQHLQKLEINMRNCRFGDEAITLLSKDVLSKLYNLKSLGLNMNSSDITNKSLEGIAKYAFPSLKDLAEFHIDLSKTAVTTQGLIQLFIPKETLKKYTLKLGWTKIDNICIKTFAQKMLTTLENLEEIELDLGHTTISDEALSYIFVNYHNAKSFRLALNDTKISNRTLETFAENTLYNAKNLQALEINLSNTFIGDHGMIRLIGKIPPVTHLSFVLDNTTITDDTITALAESPNIKFEDLESLRLSLKCTIVTDSGVSKLFKNMISMKSFVLNLGETEISDASVKAFVKDPLQAMKKLESLELYFYETSVTDDSLIELFEHVKQLKKFVLDIRSTGISDKSLDVLLWNVIPEMKYLEELEVHTHNTKVTPECAAQIEEVKERFLKE